MKKTAALFLALTLALALGLCLSGCGGGARDKRDTEEVFAQTDGETEEEEMFSGGSGTEADPWVITTAAQLNAVRNHLGGHYRLSADIDLSGMNWTPIGTFIAAGESAKEQGIPPARDAFSGTFDGGSHTISNLVIEQPEGDAVGLFGCTSGAHIYNLTVDSATISGHQMTGAVVGYAYNSRLTAVSLTGNNTITGYNSKIGGAEGIGGVIGLGRESLIDSCAAKAAVMIPDGAGNAGILGGDLTTSSVINGYATGTLTAGNKCCCLGAVAGRGFGSPEIINCTAENVRITAGDHVRMVGAVAGCAGGYEEEAMEMAVTAVSRCRANNVEISTGNNASAVGELIGGGFYLEELAVSGAPYDVPAVFTIEDCSADVMINAEGALEEEPTPEADSPVNETERTGEEAEETAQ